MSTNTPNYNLEKPNEEEFYDVNVQNGNMDKIDSAINALAVEVASGVTQEDLTAIDTKLDGINQGVDEINGKSDQIKQNTETIKTITDATKTVVDSINTNTGAHIPISFRGTTNLTANTWYTIYNATGKGFLDTAFVSSVGTGTNTRISIEITIDDVVVSTTTINPVNAEEWATGIFNPNMLSVENNRIQTFRVSNAAINPSVALNGGYSSILDGVSHLLATPLRFNKSLKVRIKNEQSQACHYYVLGGLV